MLTILFLVLVGIIGYGIYKSFGPDGFDANLGLSAVANVPKAIVTKIKGFFVR